MFNGAIYTDFIEKNFDLENRNLHYIEGRLYMTEDKLKKDDLVESRAVAIVGYGKRFDSRETYYIFVNFYGHG